MNEAKLCNKSEFDYSLWKVSRQYKTDCLADIITEEACTVLLEN